MAVGPQYRWILLTAVVVGVLLAISALALDRRDVVWMDGAPRCPHCRSVVERYSYRCPVCREEYDWAISPEEDSPLCPFDLSVLEDQHFTARVKALGLDVAAHRVAESQRLTLEAADAYVRQLKSGRCGWCGGTGKDLGATWGKGDVCPICWGAGACIVCDGDHRLRFGEWAAARDFGRMHLEIAALPGRLPLEARRAEVKRLAKEFLDAHAGSEAAASLPLWTTWTGREGDPTAPGAARHRIVEILDALDRP